IRLTNTLIFAGVPCRTGVSNERRPRKKFSTNAERNAGTASGKVIFSIVFTGLLPAIYALSSSDGSKDKNTGSRNKYPNGTHARPKTQIIPVILNALKIG